MATRFRLTADTTAPDVSPPFREPVLGNYAHSSGLRRRLVPSESPASTLTTTAYTPDAADHLVAGTALHVQFTSAPLAAGITFANGATTKWTLQALEANAGNNLTLFLTARVTDSSGANTRCEVCNSSNATELATSLTSRTRSATQAAASYTTAAGDRLVAEFYVSGTPTGASQVQGHNASIRWGSSGAGGDLLENDTQTGTTLNPWIEFAPTITFLYTGAGTLAAGPATLAATATFAPPVYTGTAALTTGKASLVAAGTAAGGQVTAAGTLTAPAATLAATGQAVYHPVTLLTQQGPTGVWQARYAGFGGKTLTPPTWTGVGTLTAGAATLAGTAFPEYEHPVGVLTQQGPAVAWQRRYGSFASKGFGTVTATGALTAGKATLAASATAAPPVYHGTAVLVTGKATLTATGTTTTPTYHGTAALTAKGATLAATAVTTRPAFTGAGTLTAGKATLAGTALFATAVYQGVGALVAKAVTLNAAATFRTRHTGAAALTAPPAVMAGAGAVVGPAAFAVTSPAAVPANHAGAVRLTYAGTGTAWDGSTTFSVTGPPGWSAAPAVVLSPTAAYQDVTGPDRLGVDPPGPTGTLTVTCSAGGGTDVEVVAVDLVLTPEGAGTDVTVGLALFGTGTVWATTDAAVGQLFAVTGGTGATITTTGRADDTDATADLYTGTAPGTLTVTDVTTGAAATVNVGFRPGEWPTVRVPARGRTVRAGAGSRTIKDQRMGVRT